MDGEQDWTARINARMEALGQNQDTNASGYARETMKGRPGERISMRDRVVRACKTSRQARS